MAEHPTREHWDTVRANLGLVWFHVNRMRPSHPQDRDDAFQDGVFGLLRAAQLFDPTLGFKFSTYASRWIRVSIDRGRAGAAGKNYRHARRTGDTYDPPLSIDTPFDGDPGGDDRTIADTIADPSDLEDHATLAAVIAHLRAHATDDLDHALLDAAESGDERFARRVALAHGMSAWTGQLRLRRFRRLATQALTTSLDTSGDQP